MMPSSFMGRGRKTRGWWRALAVFAVLVAAAIAGCGDDDGNTKTTAATASCDSKGINGTTASTGTCIRDGITYTVANKNEVLELEEVEAKLLKVDIDKTVAASADRKAIAKKNSRFVVLTIRVKNKTGRKERFGGPGFEQSELSVGGRQFPEGASPTTLLRASFLGLGQIDGGDTVTGSMAYEVPAKYANDLVKNKAVLAVANFNDGGKIDATKRLGIIRLWK